MSDLRIDVKRQPARPMLSMRRTAPASAISAALAEMFPAVAAYLGELGVTPAGAPFTIYHQIDADTVDIEAGIPIPAPAAGRGGIAAGELPAGDAAVAWHAGAYDRLPETYAEMQSWLASEGWRAAGPHWECYWTDPGAVPNVAEWRTEVIWPVVRG